MMRTRPIIVGIVGDSAAGKTTMTRGLVNILGPDRVAHVCTDDYHKYDRNERKTLPFTALHPDCNYMDIMEMQVERLHYGQPILKPVYDHATGMLVRPEYVVPREFVIVEGLLGFSTPVLRQFYDIKVFLDPPEPLRYEWKIKRDTTKRGYTREQVLAELTKREEESAEFIRTQRDFADIVVRFTPSSADNPDPNQPLDAKLVLRPTLPHPDLTYLIEESNPSDRAIRLTLGRDAGRPVDFLEIDGHVASEHANELERAIQAHLPNEPLLDVTHHGEYQDGGTTRRSSSLALTQLLLTYHVLRMYRDVIDVPFAPAIAAMERLKIMRPTVLV
ncbi:MAG TPA: phosphoribulokinase [Longimicrobiales bacterium]|nr:phosphoribulokinase [Longimicrobiales bacterium]